METDYNLLEKKIRAEVIFDYLKESNKPLKVVCFTSGNSAKFLREQGIKVLAYGNNETNKITHWFSFSEIAKQFKVFDATSGHLPFPLMKEISKRLYNLKPLKNKFQYRKLYPIKIGSGETIICLKMAFPKINFYPIRIKDFKPTEYHRLAPLNPLVYALFKTIG